ncbi:MAG: hypothetical protein HQM08_23060 [Candidatus Riflebacteria bacterium]|nr:hypothetical protein [Candidatus Riflebacteria bacterium]
MFRAYRFPFISIQKFTVFCLLICSIFCFLPVFGETPTVLDFARISNTVYGFGKSGFSVPAGYKEILGQTLLPNGFIGAAYEKIDTGEIVIAFAGTNFPGPADLLADLGIVNSDIKAIERAIKILLGKEHPHKEGEVGKAKDVLQHARDVLITNPNAEIKSQLDSARMFTKQTLEYIDSRKRFSLLHRDFEDAKTEHKVYLAGHSLGGFLAQIVAYENHLPAITFNAPGAAGMIQNGKSDQIVNFIRKYDLVGIYGVHVGRLVVYPSSKISITNFYMTFVLRNHVMWPFIKDLEDGMTPLAENDSF